MAFTPNSTIHLLNVDFDNTYQNQRYFPNSGAQYDYFIGRRRISFTEYLTVRKSLPNGGMVSSVKVNANIDDLQRCNYMMYQNAQNGDKWFYAFITNLIYINPNATEIQFETDVVQTWLFSGEVTIKPSFVVREHSATDRFGDNIIPEKFNFQEYEYTNLMCAEYYAMQTELKDWGYLIGSTEPLIKASVKGWVLSGVYQGMYYYYYEKYDLINTFLKYMEQEFTDNPVQFIIFIPKFLVTSIATMHCVSDGTGGWEVNTDDYDDFNGQVEYGEIPKRSTFQFDFTSQPAWILMDEAYKNKKLLTSPFTFLTITNNSGDQVDLKLEDFADITKIKMELYGDISACPTLSIVPNNYKGVGDNFDCALSIKSFPQCSFNSDTFKLWLTKNQYGQALNMGVALGEVVGGVVSLASGVGAVVGGGAIIHGATSIASIMNEGYMASKQPDKASYGNPSNNLLSALGKNTFEIRVKMLKEEYIKILDDYFTMYGYQTNELKLPNISSRPYFNYIQTAGVNLVGGIPNDDMRKLKAVFDTGCTFWKNIATIGDYSVDNSPT